MKYSSMNTLSDFEFHDSEFFLEHFDDHHLTIKATYLNIHKDAEQNPYETDMEITSALITFKVFRLLSYEPGRYFNQDEDGNYICDEPQIILIGDEAHSRFVNQLTLGCTVFDLGIKESSTHFIDALGEDPFFTVCFTFDNVVIEWDEYKNKAWYELNK